VGLVWIKFSPESPCTSANRDEAVFDEPERFMIDRRRNDHLIETPFELLSLVGCASA
jgi:hypothetical protein